MSSCSFIVYTLPDSWHVRLFLSLAINFNTIIIVIIARPSLAPNEMYSFVNWPLHDFDDYLAVNIVWPMKMKIGRLRLLRILQIEIKHSR